jgi:hypothetical protein
MPNQNGLLSLAKDAATATVLDNGAVLLTFAEGDTVRVEKQEADSFAEMNGVALERYVNREVKHTPCYSAECGYDELG